MLMIMSMLVICKLLKKELLLLLTQIKQKDMKQ